MDLDLNDHQAAILTGLLVSALNDAERDGRIGPWVSEVSKILARVNRATQGAQWKVNPTGGEPFGTRVTFWSADWGNRHAVITSSPKPAGQREFLDSSEWGIVLKPDLPRGAGAGMTYVPGDQLTLGWHPDAS